MSISSTALPGDRPSPDFSFPLIGESPNHKGYLNILKCVRQKSVNIGSPTLPFFPPKPGLILRKGSLVENWVFIFEGAAGVAEKPKKETHHGRGETHTHTRLISRVFAQLSLHPPQRKRRRKKTQKRKDKPPLDRAMLVSGSQTRPASPPPPLPARGWEHEAYGFGTHTRISPRLLSKNPL